MAGRPDVLVAVGRVATAEDVLDEGLGADVLEVQRRQGHADLARRLGLGLEVELDAVVDQCRQARGDDDAVARVPFSRCEEDGRKEKKKGGRARRGRLTRRRPSIPTEPRGC